MTLTGFLLCAKGTEEAAHQELLLLKSKPAKRGKGFVLFEAKTVDQIAEVAYRSLTATHVGIYLGSTNTVTTPESLPKSCDLKLLSGWVKGTTSKTVCERSGTHDFESKEVEAAFGETLLQAGAKIQLDDPEIILFVAIDGQNAIWGLDLCGNNLGKRSYKVYNHPSALRGNLLSSVLFLTDVQKKQIVLDPFCKEGSILIEAALFFTQKSPRFFEKESLLFSRSPAYKDKIKKLPWEDEKEPKAVKTIFGFDDSLKNLKSTKANAKIAGVDASIQVSKLQVDWLETKFEKASVDRIVTQPPQFTKYANKKDVSKVLDEFFYQAEFVLKKNGKLVCVLHTPDQIIEKAKQFRLHPVSTLEVYAGTQPRTIIVFEKVPADN